jgi:hypothetical protein
MAASVQNQVQKFEEILKGYLYEGPLTPYWSLLEQKTKLKRERIALGMSLLGRASLAMELLLTFSSGLLGFIAIYLVLGWAKDFACNFIGFVYPAYAS